MFFDGEIGLLCFFSQECVAIKFSSHYYQYSGAIGEQMFHGDILAAEGQVIVVTVTYRLGLLGFLKLDCDEVTGNQGLLDQAMALKWVHEHIHNFGGNADNICIFGESVGSMSVGLHLLSEGSAPYFRRAIMMSGFPV